MATETESELEDAVRSWIATQDLSPQKIAALDEIARRGLLTEDVSPEWLRSLKSLVEEGRSEAGRRRCNTTPWLVLTQLIDERLSRLTD